MSLADAVLTALKGFANEVATWTNQGSLVSIEGHIAQIANAAAEDVHAGETAAKAVLADLYGAFHGREATPTPAELVPPGAAVTPATAITTAIAPGSNVTATTVAPPVLQTQVGPAEPLAAPADPEGTTPATPPTA